MATNSIIVAQVTSITSALLAAGGITALSIFDVPELQSQPASRSLPQIRWLFSRGSHIFPQAAELSTVGFLYLAYASLPTPRKSIMHLVNVAANSTKVNGYIAAAALVFSIAPVTQFAMIPTNFALIKMNEEKGGFRSAKSAGEYAGKSKPGERRAADSVNSKSESNQFSDLSGPQSHTAKQSTPEEDVQTRELLGKFGRLNLIRAALTTAGGVLGLVIALMP